MKLGLELLAERAADIRLGTFFETWVATAEGTVRRSLGRDEYHLGLTVQPGQRLAATGRTHICQLDLEAAGLGTNGARPSLLVPVELPEGSPLIWSIRTNLFLSLPALAAGTGARLLRDGAEPLSFRLDHPLLTAEEIAPGRYLVDLCGLLLA